MWTASKFGRRAPADLDMPTTPAIVGDGYCVPAEPFAFTGRGSRISVSDEGYTAVNPGEWLQIDPRLTFGSHDPLLAVQYNDADSNPKVNTLAEHAQLHCQDMLAAYRKVADPQDAMKLAIEMRVNVRDLPDTGDGESNQNDAKRTEHTIGRYVRSGQLVMGGFRMMVPSRDGFKQLRSGDQCVVWQYHDAGLGSGLGPTISIRYTGGDCPTRSVWVNGCATLPNKDNWRCIYEDSALDITWQEDTWEEWIFEQQLHYDSERKPWTRVWHCGSLIAEDEGINCFNDSQAVDGASHYPKFGIYWYNQSAQSWREKRSLLILLKSHRIYVDRPDVTPEQFQQLLASY